MAARFPARREATLVLLNVQSACGQLRGEVSNEAGSVVSATAAT